MRATRSNNAGPHGVLLLDKPTGYSSNQALQRVKRLFAARKAGHTGSLDPLASGLLPICFGEATKLSAWLLDADKRYRVVCRLGITTTTGDREGETVQVRPVPEISAQAIEHVLTGFRGTQSQVPPMYSALKHHGQRLYALARQGIEVARAARTITIHSLLLQDYQAPDLDLEVSCSKGTYVRTLAVDLGEVLGCGAHVIALRRLDVGPYRAAQMVDFERLETLSAQDPPGLFAQLLPADSAIAHWPVVRLSAALADIVRQGQAIFVPHAPTAGWMRLYADPVGLIGLGEILDDGRVAPRRLLRLS